MTSSLRIQCVGQGKPLVLLHGFGFDAAIWTPLLPALSAYRCYLVDLPGFGCSEIMDFATFKQKLLAQLPEKTTLLGWSMGGLYATRLALEVPDRVECLINVASSPRFLQEGDWPGMSQEVFASFCERLLRHPTQTLTHFIQWQLQGQTLPCEVMPKKPSEEGLREGLNALMTWDFRSELNEIKMPIHYLFGRLDAITPIAVMQAIQKQMMHAACEMLPQAAHVPFLSHQQAFLSKLGAWMA